MAFREQHQIWCNLREVCKDPIACLSGIAAFVVVLYLGYAFGDISAALGNLGKTLFALRFVVHFLLAVFFGLFIAATIYKIRYFRTFHTSSTTAGATGGLIGAILIGCPACSIGIASYLGLSTLLTQLPGFGLEIKILGLLLLIRATYATLRDIYTCNLSGNKKSFPVGRK